jgi:hypothetical protein
MSNSLHVDYQRGKIAQRTRQGRWSYGQGRASDYGTASRKKAGQDRGAVDRAGPTATARRRGRRRRWRGVMEEVGVGDIDGGGVEEQGRADGDGRTTVERVRAEPMTSPPFTRIVSRNQDHYGVPLSK